MKKCEPTIMRFLVLLTVFLILSPTYMLSQEVEPAAQTQEQEPDEQTQEKPAEIHRKNTIRYSLINPILINAKFQVFGYERILKNNQAFSFNLGRFALPEFDSIGIKYPAVIENRNEFGINTSFDYRFYLHKINKFEAPRGVYIGPFASFNYLKRNNNWSFETDFLSTDISSEFTFYIATVGMEIGYQFVFWDRLSLDLIMMGPGIGFYGIDLNLKTTLTPDEESKFFEVLQEILLRRYPGSNRLFNEGKFDGSFSTLDFGFRYLMHIGYKF